MRRDFSLLITNPLAKHFTDCHSGLKAAANELHLPARGDCDIKKHAADSSAVATSSLTAALRGSE